MKIYIQCWEYIYSVKPSILSPVKEANESAGYRTVGFIETDDEITWNVLGESCKCHLPAMNQFNRPIFVRMSVSALITSFLTDAAQARHISFMLHQYDNEDMSSKGRIVRMTISDNVISE